MKDMRNMYDFQSIYPPKEDMVKLVNEAWK